METTVYIQSENKFPFDDWACTAYLGFRDQGGDFRLYPDIFKVEQMTADYTKAPRAYSIDVAVQKDSGETILIECNDGWSLGNYGLSPKQYVRLLTTRWREIITKK